jgi:hypothetical protein
MILGFQEITTPSRPFDPDVVWQVFSQLFARLMAPLPYLILGFVVFVVFLIAARLAKSNYSVYQGSYLRRRTGCITKW